MQRHLSKTTLKLKRKVWQRTSWNSTKTWPSGTLLPLILKWFHKSFSVVMRCFRLHKCTPTAQPDTTTVKLFFQELDIHPTYLHISAWWRMKTLSEHTRKKKIKTASILLCLNFYLHTYIAYKCILWAWSWTREIKLAVVGNSWSWIPDKWPLKINSRCYQAKWLFWPHLFIHTNSPGP